MIKGGSISINASPNSCIAKSRRPAIDRDGVFVMKAEVSDFDSRLCASGEMPLLNIEVGETIITVHFEELGHLQAACEKYGIELNDKRGSGDE